MTVPEGKSPITHRHTRRDVLLALAKLEKAAEKVGVKEKGEVWVLTVGSRANKKPWELRRQTGNGQTLVKFFPHGFLGWTAEQSCNNIRLVRLAWQYVIDKQEAL